MSPLPPSQWEFSDLLHPAENSGSQKLKEILTKYPLPPHWGPPNTARPLSKLSRIYFKIMCLCAFGQPSLKPIWAAIKLEEDGDASAWREGQRRTCKHLSNLLVVAGLLLATSAVFITTVPPNPAKLDYTRRGPYLCVCGAFGILIGTIIVTSACIIVTDKIPASHAGNVFYANTVHVYCTLMIIVYPSVSLTVATLLLAFGNFAAAWAAKDLGFQLSTIVLLLITIVIGGMFGIASMPISRQAKTLVKSPEEETEEVPEMTEKMGEEISEKAPGEAQIRAPKEVPEIVAEEAREAMVGEA